MLGSNVCWGIDIGSSSVKAVKIQRMKQGLEITGLDLIEFETKGPDAEESTREEQIREALTILKSRNKIKNEPIFVSIPGQGTYNRTISLPPVEKKRIPEIVKYEAQQQIPFPIDEVIWDYHPIGADDEVGGELEVSLFAVKREIINNFMSSLRACDIQIEGIQVAPIALYNFIRYDLQVTEPTVVIDIGAENSDLIVVDGERLWMRSLQIAGNEITKELQKKFQIPFEEAEKLKLKAKKSKQAKKIFNIIRPILKDMVNEIHRSVGYYKSLSKGVKFERMVFMGNSTKLMGFKRFFSQNLQYSVEVFQSIQRIAISNKVNVNMLNQNVTTFGVSIGLAIQGVGGGVNNIRLIPPEIRKRQEVVKKKPWFAGVAVVLGVLVAVVGILDFAKLSKAESLPTPKTAQKNPGIEYESWKKDLAAARDVSHLERQRDLLAIFGEQREIIPAFIAKTRTLVPEVNDTDLENQNPADKVWLLEVRIDRKMVVVERFKAPAAGGRRGRGAAPVAETISPMEEYLPTYEGVVVLAVTTRDENNQEREGRSILDQRILPVLRKTELKPDDPDDPAQYFFRSMVFRTPANGGDELTEEYARAVDRMTQAGGMSREQAIGLYRSMLGEYDRRVWSAEGKPDPLQFQGLYFPRQATLSHPDKPSRGGGFGADQQDRYMFMKVGLKYEFPYKDAYEVRITNGGASADLLGRVLGGAADVIRGGFIKADSGAEVDLVVFAGYASRDMSDKVVERRSVIEQIEAALGGPTYANDKSSTRHLVFAK